MAVSLVLPASNSKLLHFLHAKPSMLLHRVPAKRLHLCEMFVTTWESHFTRDWFLEWITQLQSMLLMILVSQREPNILTVLYIICGILQLYDTYYPISSIPINNELTALLNASTSPNLLPGPLVSCKTKHHDCRTSTRLRGGSPPDMKCYRGGPPDRHTTIVPPHGHAIPHTCPTPYCYEVCNICMCGFWYCLSCNIGDPISEIRKCTICEKIYCGILCKRCEPPDLMESCYVQ